MADIQIVNKYAANASGVQVTPVATIDVIVATVQDGATSVQDLDTSTVMAVPFIACALDTGPLPPELVFAEQFIPQSAELVKVDALPPNGYADGLAAWPTGFLNEDPVVIDPGVAQPGARFEESGVAEYPVQNDPNNVQIVTDAEIPSIESTESTLGFPVKIVPSNVLDLGMEPDQIPSTDTVAGWPQVVIPPNVLKNES